MMMEPRDFSLTARAWVRLSAGMRTAPLLVLATLTLAAPARAADPCLGGGSAAARGRKTGGWRRAARAKPPAGTVQHVCAASHFVVDACSGDATNACLPACGDGVANGTEQCDGTDDAACPGLCGTDCACPRVEQTTVEIPSAAAPQHTPGSPGVTVTNAKLL